MEIQKNKFSRILTEQFLNEVQKIVLVQKIVRRILTEQFLNSSIEFKNDLQELVEY